MTTTSVRALIAPAPMEVRAIRPRLPAAGLKPMGSGTATGLINMGVMSGPMLLQPLVGGVLDLAWQGRMADGLRLYGLRAYQAGFGLMLVWTVLALVLLVLTRETRCRGLEDR